MTKRSMKADFLKFAEIIVLTVLFVLVSGCDTKEESLGGEEEGRVITQTACRNLHPRNRRTAGIEKAGGEAVPMDCVGWAR